MPRAAARRAKRRLACAMIVGRQRFSGVILDLSSTGIFVQTTARPKVGEPVALELGIPGQKQTLRVQAQVVRLKVVPAQLLNHAQGGIGLRITNAPEGYFEFLTAVLPQFAKENDAGSPAAPVKGPVASDAPPVKGRVASDAAPPEGRTARAGAAAPPARPAPGRGFRVRVQQIGGARSRTLRLRASSAGEAAAAGLREVGAGWKVLEAEEE
jgi:Tfp pilus assembly protein PilZ